MIEENGENVVDAASGSTNPPAEESSVLPDTPIITSVPAVVPVETAIIPPAMPPQIASEPIIPENRPDIPIIIKNRRFFTKQITKLVQEMIDNGETPIYDYTLRSAAEQKRLYDAGLSKCDGIIKISQHQKGKAADIYLVDKNGVAEFEWTYVKAVKWHSRWEELGGDKIILWDLGHFQISG